MINKTYFATVVASFLLLASTCARADSFTLGFSAGTASADTGGEIQIGYSFVNSNPSWWAVVSSISAELPPSNLIGALQFPQASFVVDPLSTLSSPTGLIDFSWDSDAPAGYSFS